MTEPKCSSCPECGCEEVLHNYIDFIGLGFRYCAKCGQEWWTDVHYAGHINDVQAAQGGLAQTPNQ